ncbi:MAG: hypothetical protein V4580_05720 [Bacteroidota bacterium]
MKITFLISTFSLGIALTSFTTSKPVQSIFYSITSDSIPEMNQKIVAFAASKLNKKVGTGECWDLAAEALKSINAKWDMQYKFGKEINYKKEPVYPGDIIQFENVVLTYEIDKRKYMEKMSHHTAIVYEVKGPNNFTLIHQNTGYTGRKVGTSPLDLNTLTKGKFKVFRAER